MKDINEQLNSVYEDLNRKYTTEILSPTTFNKLGFSKYAQVWKSIREISVPNQNEGFKSVECDFFICFKSDYPYSFPNIYISKQSYQEVLLNKPIPHIDDDFLICTIDKEKYSPDSDDPKKILEWIFERAIKIIESSLVGDNTNEFRQEFNAYWKLTYGQSPDVRSGLSLIKNHPINGQELSLIVLSKESHGYRYVLHDGTEEYQRLIEYLNLYGIKFEETKAFFIDGNSISNPPFTYKVGDTLKIIDSLGSVIQTAFKLFLNKNNTLIVFNKSWGSIINYYGWFYNPKSDLKGFRSPIKPFDYINTIVGKAERVSRIAFNNFSSERLMLRSGGAIEVKRKFMVSGLGSIGSNLIYFLNNYEVDTFILNDLPNEVIEVENIKRHLVGFSRINYRKTDAILSLLTNKNPLQKVIKKDSSLTNLLKEEPQIINEVDFLFVCIGKKNIEEFVCESLAEGKYQVPTFIFWVEPYLASGQILYINPNDGKEAYDLIKKSVFDYNVIHEDEYYDDDSIVYLKEAGCQSGYSPFSSNSIILFLSAVYPILDDIIKSGDNESKVITWIGDLENIQKLGLRVSEFGKIQKSKSVLVNSLKK